MVDILADVETYRGALETRALVHRVAVDLHVLSDGILRAAAEDHPLDAAVRTIYTWTADRQEWGVVDGMPEHIIGSWLRRLATMYATLYQAGAGDDLGMLRPIDADVGGALQVAAGHVEETIKAMQAKIEG